MSIFRKILDWFKDRQTIKKETIKDSSNYIDMLISLNKNFDIDITLYMDKSLCDQESGSLVSSEFFHILNSGKLKSQIWSILNEEIRENYNNEFIDNIFLIDKVIQQHEKKYNSIDTFIKPSTVFTKNMI